MRFTRWGLWPSPPPLVNNDLHLWQYFQKWHPVFCTCTYMIMSTFTMVASWHCGRDLLAKVWGHALCHNNHQQCQLDHLSLCHHNSPNVSLIISHFTLLCISNPIVTFYHQASSFVTLQIPLLSVQGFDANKCGLKKLERHFLHHITHNLFVPHIQGLLQRIDWWCEIGVSICLIY